MTRNNHPKDVETGEDFFISPRERYTLSNRWIVRSDPNFHTHYSAFKIDSGDKYKISGTLFIILKLLQNNSLTIEQVCNYLREKGIELQAVEIINLLKKDLTSNILTKSEKVLSPHVKHHQTFIKSDVPVTSTPYEAEVHFTNACNLKCRHCVYDAGQKISNQLEADSWFKIFDQFESLETFRVIISGGEPLVYPKAKTIIQYLTSKRIRIELLTNGTLIDESLAVILSSPNFSTTVSLDGADSETHNMLRGQECFDKVIKGLKFLSQAGACFHISTTVHNKNIHQLKDLVETAIELGAKSINFILLDPLGRAKHQDDLLLGPSEIINISHTAKQLTSEYGDSIYVGYLDPSVPEYKDLDTTEGNSKIFCTAGTTRMAIRSDGIVFPCVYAFHDDKFAMGSARLQNIEDIWISESWKLFRGSIELQNLNECKSCSLSSTCTLKICRLRAYYNDGNFFGKPPGCQKALMKH